MAAHSDPFVLTQRIGRPAGPGGSYGGWAMEGFNWTIFALALAMATLLPAARGKVTMSLSILIFGVATALAGISTTRGSGTRSASSPPSPPSPPSASAGMGDGRHRA